MNSPTYSGNSIACSNTQRNHHKGSVVASMFIVGGLRGPGFTRATATASCNMQLAFKMEHTEKPTSTSGRNSSAAAFLTRALLWTLWSQKQQSTLPATKGSVPNPVCTFLWPLRHRSVQLAPQQLLRHASRAKKRNLSHPLVLLQVLLTHNTSLTHSCQCLGVQMPPQSASSTPSDALTTSSHGAVPQQQTTFSTTALP